MVRRPGTSFQLARRRAHAFEASTVGARPDAVHESTRMKATIAPSARPNTSRAAFAIRFTTLSVPHRDQYENEADEHQRPNVPERVTRRRVWHLFRRSRSSLMQACLFTTESSIAGHERNLRQTPGVRGGMQGAEVVVATMRGVRRLALAPRSVRVASTPPRATRTLLEQRPVVPPDRPLFLFCRPVAVTRNVGVSSVRCVIDSCGARVSKMQRPFQC